VYRQTYGRSCTPSNMYASWIADRAGSYRASPPRLESSLYGLVNAILTSVFRPEEGYMVKPQPKLRSSLDNPRTSLESQRSGELAFSPLSDYSVDSWGRPAGSSVLVPDFIVASVSLGYDVPVLVVEVKTEWAGGGEDAEDQLRGYLQRATDQQGSLPVAGILCTNVTCLAFAPTLPQDPASVAHRGQRLEGAVIERFMRSLKIPPSVPRSPAATRGPPPVDPGSRGYKGSGPSSRSYEQAPRLTNEYVDALLDEGRREFGF